MLVAIHPVLNKPHCILYIVVAKHAVLNSNPLYTSLVSYIKFGDSMDTSVGKRPAAAVGRFSLNFSLPI